MEHSSQKASLTRSGQNELGHELKVGDLIEVIPTAHAMKELIGRVGFITEIIYDENKIPDVIAVFISGKVYGLYWAEIRKIHETKSG